MQNNSITCDPKRIELFLKQKLSDEEQTAFELHLDDCTDCRRLLEATAASDDIWSGIRDSLRGEHLPLDNLQADDADLDSAAGGDVSFHHSTVLNLLAPTDDERMLGRLGTYEVVGVIGSGGMGVVLKALDAALNRYVAIKVLAPHLGNSGGARKRFSREAQAAAAVVHDNVIEIYGVADVEGLPYLVMPYVRGPSLQRRLDDAGPLALVEILRIAVQAASGLAASHAQGLVHRDVKPANILLADGIERVKLTDFGLARAADDASLTKTGIIAGTPQYMSPEQARGESVDQRSDLFSLGSVLYAMCTGRAPFRAETSYGVLRRITDEVPRPIRELNPEIPEWLCRIIGRLMSKQPEDRFESAAAVAELLKTCLAHVQQPTAVPLPEQVRDAEPARNGWRGRSLVQRLAVGTAFAFAFIWAGVLVVLELNKGTLTIQSEADDVPIRIMKGDTVAETMTVTTGGASARITAGQYVVEIDGEMDGIKIENGAVHLQRGGRQVVKIVKDEAAIARDEKRDADPKDDMQILLMGPRDAELVSIQGKLKLPGLLTMPGRTMEFDLTQLPNNPKLKLVGSLEPVPLNEHSQRFLKEHAISLELNDGDVQKASHGMVTKYIFLPHQKPDEKWAGHFGTLTMGRVDPESDKEVRNNLKKRGDLLLVFYLWSKDDQTADPGATLQTVDDLPLAENATESSQVQDDKSLVSAARHFNTITADVRRELFNPPIANLSVERLRLGLQASAKLYRRQGEARIADVLQKIADSGQLRAEAVGGLSVSGVHSKDKDGNTISRRIVPALIWSDDTTAINKSLIFLRPLELIYRKYGAVSKDYGDQFDIETGKMKNEDAVPTSSLIKEVVTIERVEGNASRALPTHPTDPSEIPLWNSLGVTPTPVSSSTAKVLEWIGLHLCPITKDAFREKNVFAKYDGGLDVTFVRTHGPAEKGGFNEVDIVVGLQGRPLASLWDLDIAMRDATQQIKRGEADSLQFDVLRSGETIRVKVPLSVSQFDRGTEHESNSASMVPASDPPPTTPAQLHHFANLTTGHDVVIACSPDGQRIAIAGNNPTMVMLGGGRSRTNDGWKPSVNILEAGTGKIVASLKLSTAEEDAILAATERVSHFEPTALAFSPDGKVGAVGTSIGQVKLFDAQTGELVRSLDDEAARLADKETPENWKPLQRAMGRVASLAFSPDGSQLATCGGSIADFSELFDGVSRLGLRGTGPGRLKLWDVASGTLKHDLVAHNDFASAVAFSPDGNWLASAGRWIDSGDFGNGVILWDARTDAPIHRLIRTTANAGARSIAFSPDSKRLALGTQRFDGDSSSGGVSVVRVSSGTEDWLVTVPGWAKPVSFSPDGKSVVALCGGKSIRFLDAETGTMQQEIRPDDSPEDLRWKDFAIAAQGNLLAIGGVDKERKGSVEVWDYSAPNVADPLSPAPDQLPPPTY